MSNYKNEPHVFYTISELSHVKDLNELQNLNIKTLAFIIDGRGHDLEFQNMTVGKSEKFLKLDLKCVLNNFDEMKPYIIFGMLYTSYHRPHILVKTIKRFEESTENLIIYWNQCMATRMRNPAFKNIKQLSKLP